MIKSFRWHLAHDRFLDIGPRSLIMGTLNVTPNSFSDGGLFLCPNKAVDQALAMIEEGADIIDIGGESTAPNSFEIPQEEEEKRVMPVIERLVKKTNIILSIDTFREKTAQRAIDSGVHIINDVYSLRRSPALASLAAKKKAGLIIMRTGRDRDRLADVIHDQNFFLQNSLEIAKKAGVKKENIVLDPGFGFHEDVKEDIYLLSHFETLHAFGYPILVGLSRKRIIGLLTNTPLEEREAGTIASSVFLRMKGASLFRVHNVKNNRQALAFVDSILHP